MTWPEIDRCPACGCEVPAESRRDALTCSQRCRQARHRFTRAVGRGVASGRPLRLAYADPPYPGKAWLYRDHPDFGGEVDHAALIRRLSTYDGWALSTSAEALPQVLHDASRFAGTPVAVAAWHRGERPNRLAVRPLSAWEPVIYSGGRALASTSSTRRVDSLVYVARARTTDPRRVIGAKPARFARFIFDLLGAQPGDSFDDLFPGSGGMARAWATFSRLEDPGDASLADQPDASYSRQTRRLVAVSGAETVPHVGPRGAGLGGRG